MASCMDDEIQSLKENGTWEEVDPPAGRRIVDSKWVYKIKQKADGSIERYKARVVAKGFSQQFGSDYEETFARVARYDSFKLLLAIAAHMGWKPQQMDVKTAFLYGTLKEEIYMRLPEGYRTRGKAARLYKCIYGLKQSARKWYECLSTLLKQIDSSAPNSTPVPSSTQLIRHSSRLMWMTWVYSVRPPLLLRK